MSFLVASALFLQPVAQALPTPPASVTQTPPGRVEAPDVPVTAGISGRSAKKLAESMGSNRTGGVFVNDSGRMVIAVTDQAAAQAVRNGGGLAQVVTYSTDTLKAIHSELDKLAGIPGSSWGVDPSTNQVSVELDSTVSAADKARLRAVGDRSGSAVRIDQIAGKLEMTESSSGGDRITKFTDFQRILGIAPNILANRLDGFVAAGLMQMRQYSDQHHEYVLTDKGLDLQPAIIALTEWGDRWAAPDGPPVIYRHHDCGGQVELRTHCSTCGKTPPPAQIIAQPGPGTGQAG